MFRPTFTRAIRPRSAYLRPAQRFFSITPQRAEKSPKDDAKYAGAADQTVDVEEGGKFARTDESVRYEYPGEEYLPSSRPAQGRAGWHFKRTLASFSLEGRTGIVTGGARGLGLVMAQALVNSGANVAIVDMHSKRPRPPP